MLDQTDNVIWKKNSSVIDNRSQIDLPIAIDAGIVDFAYDTDGADTGTF